MEVPNPRRRQRSSNESQQQAVEPTTPTNVPGPVENLRDVATGFVDIYQGLSPRQVGVIAIGSAIGTGLMITTGMGLALGGPAAIIISYTVVGLTVYLVLSALGEVAAWLPKPYTVADQAVRFCDPALGFSLGWIYWLKYAIVTPNQLIAATLVISYWVENERVSRGVWITVFLVVIVSLNYVHHGLPSQVEFYVSFVKLVVMFALMILSLVIALGGGPDGDLKGFRYWKHPGAFGARPNTTLIEKLFRTCGTMSSATFAYVGSERSGIMAQSPNVRKAISRAIKNTYYRILVFHLIGVTLLGMIVPYNSAALVFSSTDSKEKAASPFVAALYCAGMAVVPDLLNGFILLFVLSIANYDLYLATKAMCDLSLKYRAPGFLSRSNHRGVPIYALGVCSLLASLAYISLASNAIQAFGYFVDTVTMLGLLTWISILITHVSFVRARKAQGIPDTALIFRARFGLPGTWFALCLCLFIAATIVFKAFSFKLGTQEFDYRTVVASYFGVPLYIGLFVGYKFVAKSKFATPQEVDLGTDKQNPRQREMENIRG